MGIRLGVRPGVAVLNEDRTKLLRELVKSTGLDSFSEIEISDEFIQILSLDDIAQLKATCEKLGLDAYTVKSSLDAPRQRFGIRDFEYEDEVVVAKKIAGCDFLSKEKKFNPILFQNAFNCRDTRYGDTLDSYLLNNYSYDTNHIKFIGAGMWPITGYVAKHSFSSFEKGRSYYWSDVVAYCLKKLENVGMTLKQAEKRAVVPEIIGLSEDFHPAVGDDILYLIYAVYKLAGKQDEFNKEDWMFELYPCIILNWS